MVHKETPEELLPVFGLDSSSNLGWLFLEITRLMSILYLIGIGSLKIQELWERERDRHAHRGS